MANPYGALGPNTGYIPTTDATNGMVIGYSRNVTDFRIHQYCLIKPVDRQKGYYQRFNPAVGARLGPNFRTDAVWNPGADRPDGLKNQQELELVGYQTVRYAEAVTTDRLAIQQSDWAVEDQNARNLGQIAMTRRTALAHDALANNAWGTNTAPVTAGLTGAMLGGTVYPTETTGANWTTGTTSQPNVFACLNYAARRVALATYGVVKPNQMVLVINPNMAAAIALSPEIQDAFKNTQYALSLVRGDDTSPDAPIAAYNATWGLPLVYRGFTIVVEDAVYDTTSIPSSNTSGVGAWIMPDNEAYLLCRPNKLSDRVAKMDQQDASAGQTENYYPIANSLVMFTKEEFTVEAFDDPRNRRVDAHVTYDFQMQVPSSLSGWRFTDIIS